MTTDREIIWHKTGRILGAYRFSYDANGVATLEENLAEGWTALQLGNQTAGGGTGGGGATALSDLSDVQVSNPPGEGHVLTWDSGTAKWVNATPSGGGGGVDVEGVQDTTAAMFAAGTHENVVVTYDDASGSLSLTVAGGGEGGLTQEQVEDLVALMVGGTHSGIVFAYNDAAGTLTATVSGFQPADVTLTALASLDTTAGIVEQTGADAFAKRPFGVGGATSVPTRADADARYAALAHGHPQSEVVGLTAALAGKVETSAVGAANGVAPLGATSKVPASYLEVIPAEAPPVFPVGGTIPSLTVGEQALVSAGTVVVQSNGQRYMYTGSGSKTATASYVLLSDLSPDWSEISGVPATFPPSAHTHPQADVTGLTAALALKAPLASPALTGTPTAPTPTVGDATTKLATTAFVSASVGGGGYATPNKQVRSGAITTVLTTGELVLGSATAALTGRHSASEIRIWGAVSIQKTAAAASTWTVRVRRGTTTAGTLIATATATSTVSGNACVIPVEGFDPLGAATGQYVVTVQASVANATATYYQVTALEVGGAPGPAGPPGTTMGFTVSAAVGDGTDDGPVLKAEIEALAALPQGGALMLSPGKTYLVGTITLTSLSKVHIWGGFAPADNRGNAKLKLKSYVGSTTACHRQCPLVMISCTDMQITGVDLDGSRGEHPGFVGSAVMHSDFGNGSMNALSLISCQRFRADRVGMVNSNTDGLWITGKRTWTPYTAGDSSPPSSELTFVDCVMNRNGRLGMIAITCRRATWVRCNFDDNGDVTVQPDGPGCGIDLETDVGLEDASIGGTWQAPDDLNFEDCTWRRNGSGGIIHSNRHGNRAGRLSIRNCRGSGNGRFISASFNSLDIQIFALPETVGTNVNAEVYSVEIVGGSYRSQGIYIGTFDTSNTRQERFHVLVQNVQLGGRAGVVCKQGRGNVDVIGCRSDRLTVVISSVQTTPPASPTHGDLFIKPAGATGVWSGFPTGHLLAYNGDAAAWGASAPSDGDIVYSLDHGSGANTWLTYHEHRAGAHVVGSAASAGWETFAAFLSPLDKIKVQSWWDGTIRISGNELEATGASHACIYVSSPSACATDVYVENNICENTAKKLLGGPFATGDTGYRGIRYDGNYRDVEFAGNYLLNCGTGLDLTGTGTTRIIVKGNRYKGNTTPQVIAAGLPITNFEGERFIEGTADPDLPAVSGGGGTVGVPTVEHAWLDDVWALELEDATRELGRRVCSVTHPRFGGVNLTTGAGYAAAFAAAVAYLVSPIGSAVGGELWHPKGTYTYATDLVMATNKPIKLVGEGHASWLIATANAKIVFGAKGASKEAAILTKMVGGGMENIRVQGAAGHNGPLIDLAYTDFWTARNVDLSVADATSATRCDGIRCQWTQYSRFYEVVTQVNGYGIHVVLETTSIDNEDHFHFYSCNFYNSKVTKTGDRAAGVCFDRQSTRVGIPANISFENCHFAAYLTDPTEPLTNGILVKNPASSGQSFCVQKVLCTNCHFEQLEIAVDCTSMAVGEMARFTFVGCTWLGNGVTLYGLYSDIYAAEATVIDGLVQNFKTTTGTFAQGMRCTFVGNTRVISLANISDQALNYHLYTGTHVMGKTVRSHGVNSVPNGSGYIYITYSLDYAPTEFQFCARWIAPGGAPYPSLISATGCNVNFPTPPTGDQNLNWTVAFPGSN